MAKSLERCFGRALQKHFPRDDCDTDEEFQVTSCEKEKKEKKRNKSQRLSGPESLIHATEIALQRKSVSNGKKSLASATRDAEGESGGPKNPSLRMEPSVPTNTDNARARMEMPPGLYLQTQKQHSHPGGPPGPQQMVILGQNAAMPLGPEPNPQYMPHQYSTQAPYGEGQFSVSRYPMPDSRPFPHQRQKQHLGYMGPQMHVAPFGGPRPVALQSPGWRTPSPEGSVYPSYQRLNGGQMFFQDPSRHFGSDLPHQSVSHPPHPPPSGPGQPSPMWPGFGAHLQHGKGGATVADHDVGNHLHSIGQGMANHPVPPRPWPEQHRPPHHNDQSNSMPAQGVVSSLQTISQRPMAPPPPPNTAKSHLASMLESPEMLALQQLSASSRAFPRQPMSVFPMLPKGTRAMHTSQKSHIMENPPVHPAREGHSAEIVLAPSKTSNISTTSCHSSDKQETPGHPTSLENPSAQSQLKTDGGVSLEKQNAVSKVEEGHNKTVRNDGNGNQNKVNLIPQQDRHQQVCAQSTSEQTVSGKPTEVCIGPVLSNSQNKTIENVENDNQQERQRTSPSIKAIEITNNASSSPQNAPHLPPKFSSYSCPKGQGISQSPGNQSSQNIPAVVMQKTAPLEPQKLDQIENYQRTPNYPPTTSSCGLKDTAEDAHDKVLRFKQERGMQKTPELSNETSTSILRGQSGTPNQSDNMGKNSMKQTMLGSILESQDGSNANIVLPARHSNQSVKSLQDGRSFGFPETRVAQSQVVTPSPDRRESHMAVHYNHIGQPSQLFMQHNSRSAQSSNCQPQNQNIPQNVNMHSVSTPYPSYPHCVPYSYQLAGKPHEGNSNYLHYQQLHNRPDSLQSRGGIMNEEWSRPQSAVPSSLYFPQAHSNGRSKGPSVSSMSSDGTGSNLVSPNRSSNVSHSDPVEAKEAISSVTPTPVEDIDRAESPKEILDLDSHKLAAQSHPTTHQRSLTNQMYNPPMGHGGMQPDGYPDGQHMMAKARFPSQNFTFRGQYGPQPPRSHLLEALKHPQQLPFSPGQPQMSVFRQAHTGSQFQNRMVPQFGLPPEHFFHPR